MKKWIAEIILLCVTAGLFTIPLGAKEKPPVPDLTQGGKCDDSHDWTLGATGARGWIWGWNRQTSDARQILITAVAIGSPSDGILKEGDVIVGLNGKPFGGDARIALAQAITVAEARSGTLDLMRWREGSVQGVTIRIPVLGAYSATAPYNCAKSKRIFEQGCAVISKQSFKNKRGRIEINIPNDLKMLVLLGSEKKEYLPLVKMYADAVAESTPGGYVCWGYAYETLFLAEYALATKDQSVMPGLTRLANDIARGTSGVGTWGHRFARAEDKILNGYGCMNQPGIVLTLAMLVAREAGVKSPDLNRSIALSARFLRWYTGKGAIPYGDHDPWPEHDDNGKCSSGALVFNLLGESGSAAFFSRMALAAYAERECGHTGNFFNLLWALPGVALSGPKATGAYLKETAWYYDLARGWDGIFKHQGIPGEKEVYRNWDSSGAYLLAFALPLKSLAITGSRPLAVPPLSDKRVTETIENGRWNWWNGQESYYDNRSVKELWPGLSSWSPTVRRRTAQALAKKEAIPVQDLVGMLDSPVRNSRYGACTMLRYLGAKGDPAAVKLTGLLEDPDPWLCALSAEALAEMSQPVRIAALPALLKAVCRKGDPADPRRCIMGPLSAVLFKPSPGQRTPDSILRSSLDAVDAANRPLLMEVLRNVMQSEDGRIRSAASRMYPLLTLEEQAALMADIVKAIKIPAPSGEMFAYGIRMDGLELLAKLRIREGMDLCVDIMNERRWGRDFERAARTLQLYGGSAKEVLPRLKNETRAIIKGEDKDRPEKLEKLIAAIEADNSTKPLRTMEDFIKNPVTLP